MDPVDILTVAVHAAQLIRSARDPEKALVGASDALGLARPGDEDDPLAVRIARLVDASDWKRDALIQFLSKQAGPLPLNRPANGWGGAVEPAICEDEGFDSEAEDLMNYDEGEGASARDMMGAFPSFSVSKNRISGYFGGRTIVIRNGNRLSQEQAGEICAGDALTMEKEGLPSIVRGLINYPLKRPCVFTINIGKEPWSIWEVCCAFAEQYARIYEQPEKYGIWGHDLTDLWIERLFYFPDKRLIYPHIGS